MAVIHGFGATTIIELTGLSFLELSMLAAGTNPMPGVFSSTLTGGSLKGPIDQIADAIAFNFAAEIDAIAESSHADHAYWGLDLSGVPEDSAETPYKFHDIAEKVRKMPPLTVVVLAAYLMGFWDGVGHKTHA